MASLYNKSLNNDIIDTIVYTANLRMPLLFRCKFHLWIIP